MANLNSGVEKTVNLEVVTPESLDSVLREINKGVSTNERETIIRKAQDEDNWTISTDDPVMVRRLIKRYTCYRMGKTGQLRFVVPSHCVGFRQLERVARTNNGLGLQRWREQQAKEASEQ